MSTPLSAGEPYRIQLKSATTQVPVPGPKLTEHLLHQLAQPVNGLNYKNSHQETDNSTHCFIHLPPAHHIVKSDGRGPEVTGSTARCSCTRLLCHGFQRFQYANDRTQHFAPSVAPFYSCFLGHPKRPMQAFALHRRAVQFEMLVHASSAVGISF